MKTLKDYGAFIDLGGIDGFLHVGEISWTRINHPGDVLSVGQKLDVKILKVDREAGKIGLGIKQLKKNPWQLLEENYPVGATAKGKVTRTTEFGAFVELEPGMEGLIHISELDHQRVGRVTDVVRVGDEIEVKVLSLEPNRKRIALSKKAPARQARPARPGAQEEGGTRSPWPSPYERKRTAPLKGGTGRKKAGGGLFGDPGEFEE